MTTPYDSEAAEEPTTQNDSAPQAAPETKWPINRVTAIVLGVVLLCAGIYAMYKLSPVPVPVPEVKA